MQSENMNSNRLEKVLKEEITIYKSLLNLEANKKDAILHSHPKELEGFSKESGKLLNNLDSLETEREKIMKDIYKAKNVEPTESNFNLSGLLNVIEKELSSRFKFLADEMRKIVTELKERISVNESLLKSKLEIFALSIEALKQASETPVTEPYGTSVKSRARTNIMLNTRA